MKKSGRKPKEKPEDKLIEGTRKLTQGDVDEVYRLALNGLPEKDIAEAIGYDETYFSGVIKIIPEVSEALKKGRRELKRSLIEKIIKSGIDSKFWTANAWLLERIYKQEFAPLNKLEHTGEDGHAIKFEVVHANNKQKNRSD